MHSVVPMAYAVVNVDTRGAYTSGGDLFILGYQAVEDRGPFCNLAGLNKLGAMVKLPSLEIAGFQFRHPPPTTEACISSTLVIKEGKVPFYLCPHI
jgi:hypothetical protein